MAQSPYGPALYDDEYCAVYRGTVEIKWYYFPTSSSKIIDVKTIRGIYYREQVLKKDCFKVKGWGMSLSPCWWGCDVMREMHAESEGVFYNVVIDCGERLYKGFSTNHIDNLLFNLKSQISPDVQIVNDLPF